jgi:hypothetical protein
MRRMMIKINMKIKRIINKIMLRLLTISPGIKIIIKILILMLLTYTVGFFVLE